MGDFGPSHSMLFQLNSSCRAEPRPTRLLPVHTLFAYLFCHMEKKPWQTFIRVIIILYDAKGSFSFTPTYCL